MKKGSMLFRRSASKILVRGVGPPPVSRGGRSSPPRARAVWRRGHVEESKGVYGGEEGDIWRRGRGCMEERKGTEPETETEPETA